MKTIKAIHKQLGLNPDYLSFNTEGERNGKQNNKQDRAI